MSSQKTGTNSYKFPSANSTPLSRCVSFLPRVNDEYKRTFARTVIAEKPY